MALSLAGAVILLATGLRAYRIAAQSLWYDEGVSAVMAPRGLVEIAVSSAADIHPPLYYYLLHFWTALAGTSELALRWLSLGEGVLLVAAVYAIGKRLGNREAGILASLFAAISPLLVYYAQEARMYSQVAMLGSLSFWLFIGIARWLRGETAAKLPTKVCVAYLFIAVAMLYSHYYAFTVLLAQNVVFLGIVVGELLASRIGGRKAAIAADTTVAAQVLRRLPAWVVLQAIVIVIYLPWLLISFNQLQSWPSISEALGLGTLVEKVFVVFSFGLASDAAVTPSRSIVFIALLAMPLLTPLLRGNDRYLAALLALAYLGVPVLAMYGLSLRKPMYNPKFLLLAVPAYALVLGFGLATLRRGGARVLAAVPGRLARPAVATWSFCVVVLAVSLVAYPTGRSLAATYYDPKYARDDYRSLAASIAARSGPGDAIILNAPGQIDIFRYYYHGDLPVYPLPEQRPLDPRATRARLNEIAEDHKRIWLVLWATPESDPDSVIEHWLDQNGFKVDNRWFGGPRLCEYAFAKADATRVAAAVSFEDGVRLDDFAILTPLVEAGETLNLSLTWRAERKVVGRYAVFVHVIDDRDFLWGQMDSEPVGGGVPTNTWSAGTALVDKRGIKVLYGTPPGKYRLEVGMYRPDSGQRLAILGADGRPGGDRYVFGSLEVVRPKSPPSPEALGIANPLSAVVADAIKLLGFGLNPLGRDTAGAVFAGEDIAQLTLFWQARFPMVEDLSLRLIVQDKRGQAVLSTHQALTDGRYPTSRWRDGDLVRDQLKMPLNGMRPGEYAVYVSVLDKSGNPMPVASSGTVDNRSISLGAMLVK